MKNIASVMMVTYNRLHLTKKTITSLEKQTQSPFRLLIVDNASTDGTIEYLKNLNLNNTHCIGHQLLLNDKNLGIAVGRNQCLKMAGRHKDEWLSTIDNDIEVVPNWLDKCIRVIKDNPTFMMGLNMEGFPYPLVNQNGHDIQYKKEGNLGTACTVFNKKLHDTIGFFNTEFFHGEDDSDFGYRARVAGFDLAYIQEMGTHLGVGTEDVGSYRDFKNKSHSDNLTKFRQNCRDYANKSKPVYISYKQ